MSTLNKALLRKVEWPSQTNTLSQSSQVSRNINLHCKIIWILSTSVKFAGMNPEKQTKIKTCQGQAKFESCFFKGEVEC